ncbi:hypothetical protein [Brevibacillus laterosporus]|uniref:hypothetical protein n=1 Tax=Brevibacillus laterosporus TaxID=1465 RepID=UPI003D246E36
MPRANRVLKGNKRRAVHDRLVVPKNGYQIPHNPIQVMPPDLPNKPVGQKCNITHVVLYEMYVTYEGKPAKEVHRIKFSNIVGNPVSEEKLKIGYDLRTKQGEILTVKWHHNNSNYSRSGLLVHNKKAEGTSWYEPNWGNIYGVGLEWISCDGTQSGTIWAKRHLGYTHDETSVSGESYPVHEYWSGSDVAPEYAPKAVRGGLMLGSPEPHRTMWLMGQELPIRVFPALGEIGIGCMFGFNPNVMNFVKVAPPLPIFLRLQGEGTARSDVIDIKWAKDEFHTKPTRVAIEVEMSEIVKRVTFAGSEQIGNLYVFPLKSGMTRTGSSNGTIYFNNGAGECVVRIYLLECDDTGTPQFTILKTQYKFQWGASGGTCPVPKEEYNGTLPYPELPLELCAGVEPPPTGGGDTSGGGTTEPPDTSGFNYFCDNSVLAATLDTKYWEGEKALASDVASAVQSQYGVSFSPDYWEGRNSWIEFFAKMDSKTPYRKSKIGNILPFHKYLFKMVQDKKGGVADTIDIYSFADFKSWCNSNGLSCLSDLQKASMFMSYHLEVPVNMFPSSTGYLSGSTLDVVLENLLLLPKGIYDWIDFNDVMVDTTNPDGSKNLTGAFAVDYPDVRFKALTSFINFEPQALMYRIDSAIAHRPKDYLKARGSMWGTVSPVNWTSYQMNNMSDTNYTPYVAAEVGIHEIGHAVSFYGFDHYGQTLHEMPEWLDISGWSSDAPSKSPNDKTAHLIKTRTADQTGGMPMTDAGKEAPVSDYGCFHPAEDFADAFRMYTLNPTFLESKYPNKYQFMVDKVEAMFP